MGGIRDRVRGSRIVLDSQLNGDPTDPGRGSVELSTKIESNRAPLPCVDNMTCLSLQHQAYSRSNSLSSCNAISCVPKQAAVTKVSAVSSRLGRAGLERAVEILDTLGSSMTDLNQSNGFITGVTTKDSKISILAFEVALTIVKGSNLMVSLSKSKLKHLTMVVLQSEGVKTLVSDNMDELLGIVAAEKREELENFSREVVRFGNRCRDHQWRNLDRYFEKLKAESAKKCIKGESAKKCLKAESAIHQLMTLVQYTAELFHELHMLHTLERDYMKMLKEDDFNVAQRGDIAILKAELKGQRKVVSNLKKKSLWSKNFEEVIEKLVDVVHFLHLEIREAFGSAEVEVSECTKNRLGPAGIALNYAHIIRQIDTLVSLTSDVPANTRDALYQRLPRNMRTALSTKLQSSQVDDEFLQVKAKMEKTLHWVVPIARNTINAFQGFGWVGELANSWSEVNRKPTGHTDVLSIETLYHADKEETETYIFQLLMWLQYLISHRRTADVASTSHQPDHPSSNSTFKDQEILDGVGKNILTPGISKSQNFDASKNRLHKHHRLTKSSRESPRKRTFNDFDINPAKALTCCSPLVDFDINQAKALDVIDGLHSG